MPEFSSNNHESLISNSINGTEFILLMKNTRLLSEVLYGNQVVKQRSEKIDVKQNGVSFASSAIIWDSSDINQN
jgi:hypothetical protein